MAGRRGRQQKGAHVATVGFSKCNHGTRVVNNTSEQVLHYFGDQIEQFRGSFIDDYGLILECLLPVTTMASEKEGGYLALLKKKQKVGVLDYCATPCACTAASPPTRSTKLHVDRASIQLQQTHDKSPICYYAHFLSGTHNTS